MILITDNETLKKYIPNHFAEAVGEPTFFEKVAPYLESAEEWFCREIVGTDFLASLMSRNEPVCRHIAFGVACYAMHMATAALDVVLTPNGFGIVSTQTVAPASKERVDRLRESLLKQRDREIDSTLFLLLELQEWRDTEAGRKFTSSLFMRPSDVSAEYSYLEFCDYRRRCRLAEQRITVEAVSPELMGELRRVCNISADYDQTSLIRLIRSIIFAEVAKDTIATNQISIADLVEVIRTHPEAFPQWQGTETARMFVPPVYLNAKDDRGYWF